MMTSAVTSALVWSVLVIDWSVADGQPQCSQYPVFNQAFSVVWNMPTVHRCKHDNNLHQVLTHWGIVNNQEDRWSKGEKIVLLYSSKFGRFPYYENNQPINGGLPQVSAGRSNLPSKLGQIGPK